VWFNPLTKSYIAIGRIPLAEARLQAMEANIWAAGQMGKVRLLDRLQQKDKTVREWLDEWLLTVEVAPKTLKSYKTSCNAIAHEIGTNALDRLTVGDVADALDNIAALRGDRTAQASRSVMMQAFNKAVAKGLMTANPTSVTEVPTVMVQRTRFTWATFSKVWEKVQQAPVWVRNATALALITGQRREDVAAFKFTDVIDDHLCFSQIKGGGRRKLAIPLDLRLNVLGISLREQIAMCRRTGVVSPYLVHQTENFINSAPGRHMGLDTISKRFTECVVQALGEGDNLPTYHELRSLSKRLYMQQGGVDTKALLGHATEAMAGLYGDARGAEFQRIKLG
jgi:integrase